MEIKRLGERRVAQQLIHALGHFAGGLVGKRDGQDRVGRDILLLDQPGDAVRNHAGLARSGPGQDQQRTLGGLDRSALFGIEMGEERMQGVESGGKVPDSSLPAGTCCGLCRWSGLNSGIGTHLQSPGHFAIINGYTQGNPCVVNCTTAIGSCRTGGLLDEFPAKSRIPAASGLAKAVGDEGSMASGKNIAKARAAITKPAYPLPEAVNLLKQVKYAKFDETVDLTMRLGVDTRHADQMVRGTVVLPHGLGKTKTVAVIATGDRQKEAKEAGADFVGGEEMVEKIQKENWTDFDALIATPDMMKVVGRLGKVLGPKGLMPNPKTGTVTMDVAAAVKEIKAGKVEFRADKTSLVHVPVGKLSFEPQKLIDNATTVISSIVRAKPAAAKGKYIRSVTLSSTMGPGVPLDSAVADAAGKH